MIDDVLIGFEDPVRQPVLAHEVPEIFDRVELRGFRRQRQDRYVGGHNELVGQVPARLVHDEDGMRIIGDMVGYLRQMLRHGVGIAPRHDESRRLAELGTDCTEDVGRSRPLVVWRAWS